MTPETCLPWALIPVGIVGTVALVGFLGYGLLRNLDVTAGVKVLGSLPHGLPTLSIPLIDAADLVTEMAKVKHPMDVGRKGQKGIEW